MKRNVLYSAVCVYISMLLGLTACVDDEIRTLTDMPKGETVINAVVDFNSLTPALATRAVAGDAIKNIETLWVLTYDQNGNLVHKFFGDALQNYQTTMVEHDMENNPQIAESKTPRATFQLRIPYGVYHMYAVANVDLADARYQEAIQTVEGLKGIAFQWNEKNVASNNQMFGYFTNENELANDSETVKIDRRGATYRAKIRRLASKVTVAFDGTMLHEGVYVYIKSAEIKDIPNSCLLGKENTVSDEAGLIETGDAIDYAQGITSYNDEYPVRITKGRPYYPHNDAYEKDFHRETEQALFFYENMQGVGKDKKQDPANMGLKEKGEKGYKDDKAFGTYIEVKAYYHSKNPENVTAGEIIYRFMLGKDVISDFNAERNHHYKLTLKFKNFANEVDWHIVYEEDDPSLQVPDIYYISHLYNHSMMMPLKVNCGGYELVKLEAEIDTNSWAPYEADASDYYTDLDPYLYPEKRKNHTGFLSLRKTTDKVVRGDIRPDYNSDIMDAALVSYYEATKQGFREYDVNGNGTEADGKYVIKRVENKNAYNIQVPMYTRAKQLVIPTGYTGSNPYEAYRRKAVVKFTATLKVDGGEEKKLVKSSTILQERRLVNPVGVWRKAGNDKSFHVLMQCLQSEAAKNFVPFTSEGAWKAYVLQGDKNFVKLNNRDTVYGSTGSNIDFNINFNGTIGANQNRFAIIQVEYHDYSCQHLIFVRQGDEPVALVDGGAKWYSYNMKTGTQLTESPCEEGSLFKYRKSNDPIDATSNAKALQYDANTKFLIAGTTTRKTWDEIGIPDNIEAAFTLPAKGMRIANYADYRALYDEGNYIDNGYGVLYGDDAVETQSTLEEAYGYRYDKDPKYGMRGCFVYNSQDGRHIFFPIGASGHGHRKPSDGLGKAVLKYAFNSRIVNFPFSTKAPLFWDLYKRPGAVYWLGEKLYGGIDEQGNEIYYVAWDFNYFSFDFNHIDRNNMLEDLDQNRKCRDACFVRCVVDK